MKYANDIIGAMGLGMFGAGAYRINIETFLISIGLVLMLLAYKGAKN